MGDWGLGLGSWADSRDARPHPPSPIPLIRTSQFDHLAAGAFHADASNLVALPLHRQRGLARRRTSGTMLVRTGRSLKRREHHVRRILRHHFEIRRAT